MDLNQSTNSPSAGTFRRSLRRATILGVLGVTAIVGVACGGDDDGDTTTTEATATVEGTAVATYTLTPTESPEATPTEEADATGEATETGEATPPAIATTEMGEGESVMVTYACADDLEFSAEVSQVPSTWAIIEVDGETIEMQQTISGSGIRYQGGDGYEYQSQGPDATLLKDEEVIRADCVETE